MVIPIELKLSTKDAKQIINTPATFTTLELAQKASKFKSIKASVRPWNKK